GEKHRCDMRIDALHRAAAVRRRIGQERKDCVLGVDRVVHASRAELEDLAIAERAYTGYLLKFGMRNIESDVFSMITASQMRASRALLGIDQRTLAEMSGLSLPTIQRME